MLELIGDHTQQQQQQSGHSHDLQQYVWISRPIDLEVVIREQQHEGTTGFRIHSMCGYAGGTVAVCSQCATTEAATKHLSLMAQSSFEDVVLQSWSSHAS